MRRKRRKAATPRVNRREVFSTKRTLLASCGWYAAPVQRVVKRWANRIRGDWLEEYFVRVAMPLTGQHHEVQLHVAIPSPEHWQCVFELGIALAGVLSDTRKPASWLLRFPITVARDGELTPWGELSLQIQRNRGPQFAEYTLRQTAKRLHLT